MADQYAKCRTCGRENDRRAAGCGGCGRPQPRRIRGYADLGINTPQLIGLAALVFLLLYAFGSIGQ